MNFVCRNNFYMIEFIDEIIFREKYLIFQLKKNLLINFFVDNREEMITENYVKVRSLLNLITRAEPDAHQRLM